MSRDWTLFMADIEEACEKIIRYTSGMDMAAFMADEMVRDAVLRNLEIIGEAAGKIPAHVQARYPQVDWRAMRALRNILAHAYFALDDATLWDVVANEVPLLLRNVRGL